MKDRIDDILWWFQDYWKIIVPIILAIVIGGIIAIFMTTNTVPPVDSGTVETIESDNDTVETPEKPEEEVPEEETTPTETPLDDEDFVLHEVTLDAPFEVSEESLAIIENNRHLLDTLQRENIGEELVTSETTSTEALSNYYPLINRVKTKDVMCQFELYMTENGCYDYVLSFLYEGRVQEDQSNFVAYAQSARINSVTMVNQVEKFQETIIAHDGLSETERDNLVYITDALRVANAMKVDVYDHLRSGIYDGITLEEIHTIVEVQRPRLEQAKQIEAEAFEFYDKVLNMVPAE